MKRLIVMVLIMATGCTWAVAVKFNIPDAWAASQKLSELPLTDTIRDDSRLYVFNGPTSNRNITGADFRKQALGGDGAMIKQAMSNYTSQWAGPYSQHRRISEIRNYLGKITYYVTAAGRMVVGGNPIPFAVNTVVPAGGTTGIYNNYSVRACAFTTCSTMTGVYWTGKKWTGSKYITYNKTVKSVSSSTDQFIVGKTLTLTSTDQLKYTFADYSVAAATTYTMKIWLENFRRYQQDGEWTASCPGMTDTGDGYCQSTFSTR
jgi:hypothetical protein